MEIPEPVKRILGYYESDNPAPRQTLPTFCCRASSAAPASC
jgi:hypothetical protein